MLISRCTSYLEKIFKNIHILIHRNLTEFTSFAISNLQSLKRQKQTCFGFLNLKDKFDFTIFDSSEIRIL